ncbi:MAG TPA: DJ-1 family glyoxalase III [Oscillospiraceae bacterium]|nr:DJ-1 family glyoxalase III [Oscillospiraceae bacterium]
MVALFLANGFEEIEALATADILRRAGYDLVTVGVGSRQITGTHHIAVTADIADNQLVTENLDLVILPGGMPGAQNLENSPFVQSAVHYCLEHHKYVAAICAAPFILGHLGALQGRNAVCYPGYEKDLLGAKISTESVCVDDNIITAKGAGVTIPFALKIVETLSGASAANKLKVSMQCM